MKTITIHIADGPAIAVPRGMTLQELSRQHPPPNGAGVPLLAAKVNHQLRSLAEKLESDSRVEWVTYASKEGQEIYQRTASFILFMAVSQLYQNSRLAIGHSIANGFYYDFYAAVPVNQEVLNEIQSKMLEIVRQDLPFKYVTLSRAEAIGYLGRRSMSDSLRLVQNSDTPQVQIYENGPFANFELYPVAYSTGVISRFELKTFHPGFVMLFPEPHDLSLIPPIGKTHKLFEVYQESKNWSKILGVNDIGRLNQVINQGGVSELIKVSESLHEKKIANIADQICQRQDEIRLILIAGPSGSGKTTFSKRLAIHLRVNGIRPLNLSQDNYFFDREFCPRDEKGEYDFESLEAVDLSLFNQHLADLLNGKEIDAPRYDFETGKRVASSQKLRLEEDQMLIVEGIHGLNEKLSAAVAEKNKFKIYVSALTQLSIDDHFRISTTDTRTLRRLIRDKKYRNYAAAETLRRFPSVIRGERAHVFPFQENAETMFNSALVYELAVLKGFAGPLLAAINEQDAAFSEAQRLLRFLRLFQSVSAEEVPSNSILREFIGGSSFKY